MRVIICLDRNSPMNYGHKKVKYDKAPIYWCFVKMLLHSLDYFQPQWPVVFAETNFTKDQRDELRGVHRDITFFSRDIEFFNMTKAQYMGHVTMIRAITLQHVLLNYGGPAMYMDSDMLVRGDISALESMGKGKDIVALARPDHHLENHRYSIGLLVFNHTKKVMGVLDTWIAQVDNYDYWFRANEKGRNTAGDTLAFVRAVGKLNPKMGDLSWKYNDMGRTARGLIWHGNKGDKRERLREFIREFERMFGETSFTKEAKNL